MAIAPRLRTETLTGGEIATRLLAAEGVDTVFGIIDGTYFGMYSTYAKHGLRMLTPRHEATALHMAGAYARVTGRLGVAIASNGPGVANALSGVAVEHTEGHRVLLITSCRRHGIVHPDRGGSFQVFPQVEAIGAMCKFSMAVPSADRVAEILRKAFRACYTGRPGVVHVSIPEDVMNSPVPLDPRWFRAPEAYRVTVPLIPRPDQVARAAQLLRAAKRPLLHIGTGVVHAGCFDAVRRLAERLDAPLTTSWGGRPAVDERHRLALPMLYLDALKKARNEADLVVVLGSRLGETDWWGKAPYWAKPADQQMIQVDIDPEILGNLRDNAVSIQSDVGTFVDALLEALGPASPPARPWLKGLEKARASREKKLNQVLDDPRMPMHPARIPATCRALFDDDAIMIADGGNTSVWANFYHRVHTPNTLVTTPKMGMLGAGLGQALGAKAAFPERQVYCLIGDGAMGFHMQEVETAVRNELQVIWLVFCDKQWGMVKMNQQFALKPLKTLVKGSLSPSETINADLGEIRFDDLARAMGAHGERVADPNGLRGAIQRSLASGKAAVIHVDVDPVAHLWAPDLRAFKDIHAEPKG